MIPQSIPIPIPGGLDVPLPQMLRVRQSFTADEVLDVDAAVAGQFGALGLPDLTGKSVAVAVGSRGIRSQPPVVKALVETLKRAGALPFIVPAMGSHGGGTPEGQKKIVEDYGMGEADLGIPVRSSLEVVKLGTIDDGSAGGMAVYCDKIAFEADFIVPVNRVKPHTSFRGPVESGLCKMCVIGLGKHTGAVEAHARGMDRFGELLPPAAEAFLAATRVLFAVAIVENGYEKLAHVELVPPATLVERDIALQARAKELIPRLLFDKIDVLIVDQIGKDISGAGMDPNVTGRNAGRNRDFGGPTIHRIVVRDLTPGTKGNATGMGAADLTTQRMVQKIDWTKTYVNLVTAGSPGGAALPLVTDTDHDALCIAMRSCPMATAETVRAVRIENTLDLGEIWVSTAMAADVAAHPQMEALSEPFALTFDDAGTLGPFHPAARAVA